jgi:predicted ATPase/DNA-binding winged helix-turn-helix (wHTH) protein
MIKVESGRDQKPDATREIAAGPAASSIVSFGPFSLHLAERRVERDGRPVALAARAVDILIILVERAGTVVGKIELLARIWPRGTVDDGSLRVYVAALRKALGEGEGGARYVATVSGQGYCFVARLRHPDDTKDASRQPALDRTRNLPPRPVGMVGRDQTIHDLSVRLRNERFVTIVGPGGVGKTTVGVSTGYAMLDEFSGDVHFFDLGALHDSALVPNVMASTFGLRSEDPVDGLIAFLRDKRMLLVIDCCEHVIETSAALAERLYRHAPQLHILATSRESLRAEGEHIYRLPPLASPSDEPGLTSEQALTFPAVQLFVQRASASDGRFELNDANAPLVGDICRRLDGIALAIELAASRAGAYSVSETIALLSSQFKLMWPGRRTAIPRHQTLRATLDWSYNLLSDIERATLCRFSFFVGTFTLEAACQVAAADGIDEAQVAAAAESLVAKSLLVTILPDSGFTGYRLLDTTRDYAATRLLEDGNVAATAERHIQYFSALLKSVMGEPGFGRSKAITLAPHMGNIRKALMTSFSRPSEPSVSVELAAHATPLLLELSHYPECKKWCREALRILDHSERGTQRELELQEGLTISSLWTRSDSDEVEAAIDHGLALSEVLGDGWRQIRFLMGRHMFLTRRGNFSAALATAERCAAVAQSMGGATEAAVTEWLLGVSHHFAGNQMASLRHCERGFELEVDAEAMPENVFGFYQRARAKVVLARSMWLRGRSDQACSAAAQIIRDPSESAPTLRCTALLYTIPVLLWSGRITEATEPIEEAIAIALKYSLAPDHAHGLALKGEFMIANGDASSGIEFLRAALNVLKAQDRHIATPAISCALGEALACEGHSEEALAIIEEGLARVEAAKEVSWLPSLLRVRGEILLGMPRPDLDGAEKSLLRSIDCAQRQFALVWELKGAISLARLWSRCGRSQEARRMIDRIYSQFTEGFGNPDLIAARVMLDELSDQN